MTRSSPAAWSTWSPSARSPRAGTSQSVVDTFDLTGLLLGKKLFGRLNAAFDSAETPHGKSAGLCQLVKILAAVLEKTRHGK
jgi:hypothetical protein